MSNDETRIRPGGDPASNHALPNGQKLATFLIEDVLGVGGFGITYRAKHVVLTNTSAAIKEYFPQGAAIRDTDSQLRVASVSLKDMYDWGLERFLDEAKLLSEFNHPNIVRVSDYFEDNETAYMVMDLIEGPSLREAVQEAPFSEQRLRAVLEPLLSALDEVHAKKIWHRDITPSNILLQDGVVPILIDFGSARHDMRSRAFNQRTMKSTRELTALYTPSYSPIEQYERTTQGAWTDIYALGATLYYAAFGQPPLDAQLRSGKIRTEGRDPLQSASERGAGQFSPELLGAIDAALALNANERPQSVSQWRDILGTPQNPTSDDIPVARSTPAEKRRRWLVATSIAGLIMLLAAAVTWKMFFSADISSYITAGDNALLVNPLVNTQVNDAKKEYLNARGLDLNDDRAKNRVKAADALSSFNEALEENDVTSAHAALETVAGTLGNDQPFKDQLLAPLTSVLEQRETVVNALGALTEQPFSVETAAVIERDITPEFATKSTRAQSLREAWESLMDAKKSAESESPDFTAAKIKVEEAEQTLALGNLNEPDLQNAREWIENKRSTHETNKARKYEELLGRAKDELATLRFSTKILSNARQHYVKAASLDIPTDERAQRGIEAIDALQKWLNAIEAGEFGVAETALKTAQPHLSAAGIDDKVARRARAQQEDTREKQLLAVARATLHPGSLNREALDKAADTFNQILTHRPDSRPARAGVDTVKTIEDSNTAIKAKDFDEAAALNAKLRAHLQAAGLDLNVAKVVEQNTASAELKHQQALMEANVQALFSKAKTLLSNADPLAAKSLQDARRYYQDALREKPGDPRALQGVALIDVLTSVADARGDKNFLAATQALGPAKEHLVALDFAGTFLPSLQDRLENERREALWRDASAAAQRLLNAPSPFAGALADAQTAFKALPEDDERRDKALTALSSLRQTVKQLLSPERTDVTQALATVRDVETTLSSLEVVGDFRLDNVREVAESKEAARKTRLQELASEHLAKGKKLLLTTPLTQRVLEDAEAAFRSAHGFAATVGSKNAIEVVSSLQSWLGSLDQEAFEQGARALANAGALVKQAGVDPVVIDNANSLQTVAEVTALNRLAAQILDTGPRDDKNLKDAGTLYTQAQGKLPDDPTAGAGQKVILQIRTIQTHLKADNYDHAEDTVTALTPSLENANLSDAIAHELRENIASRKKRHDEKRRSDEGQRKLEEAKALLVDKPYDNSTLAKAEALYRQALELLPDDAIAIAGLKLNAYLRTYVSAKPGSKPMRDAHKILVEHTETLFTRIGLQHEDVLEQLAQWETRARNTESNKTMAKLVKLIENEPPSLATLQTMRAVLPDPEQGDPRRADELALIESLENMHAALAKNDIDVAKRAFQAAETAIVALGASLKDRLNNARRPLDEAIQLAQTTMQTTYDSLTNDAALALSKTPLTSAELGAAHTGYAQAATLVGEDALGQFGAEITKALSLVLDAMDKNDYDTAKNLIDVAKTAAKKLRAANIAPDQRRPLIRAIANIDDQLKQGAIR